MTNSSPMQAPHHASACSTIIFTTGITLRQCTALLMLPVLFASLVFIAWKDDPAALHNNAPIKAIVATPGVKEAQKEGIKKPGLINPALPQTAAR